MVVFPSLPPPTPQSLISEGEEEDLGDEEEDEAKGMKAVLADSLLAKKMDDKSRKLSAKCLADLHSAGKRARLMKRPLGTLGGRMVWAG